MHLSFMRAATLALIKKFWSKMEYDIHIIYVFLIFCHVSFSHSFSFSLFFSFSSHNNFSSSFVSDARVLNAVAATTAVHHQQQQHQRRQWQRRTKWKKNKNWNCLSTPNDGDASFTHTHSHKLTVRQWRPLPTKMMIIWIACNADDDEWLDAMYEQEAATCAEIRNGHRKNTRNNRKSTMRSVSDWLPDQRADHVLCTKWLNKFLISYPFLCIYLSIHRWLLLVPLHQLLQSNRIKTFPCPYCVRFNCRLF